MSQHQAIHTLAVSSLYNRDITLDKVNFTIEGNIYIITDLTNKLPFIDTFGLCLAFKEYRAWIKDNKMYFEKI